MDEDAPLSRALPYEDLIAKLAEPAGRAAYLTRVGGGSLGAVLASLARRGGAPLLVVCPDAEAARSLASDVSFFLGSRDDADAAEEGRGDVLLLPSPETSPFVDVAPDRRTAMDRLATLFHLSQGLSWRVLVTYRYGLKSLTRWLSNATQNVFVSNFDASRRATNGSVPAGN